MSKRNGPYFSLLARGAPGVAGNGPLTNFAVSGDKERSASAFYGRRWPNQRNFIKYVPSSEPESSTYSSLSSEYKRICDKSSYRDRLKSFS